MTDARKIVDHAYPRKQKALKAEYPGGTQDTKDQLVNKNK